MSEIRESVQSFIDDLPLRLSKANDYINIFKESSALHQCSADLYGAILSTLDDVVQAYHKHVARKNQRRCCSIDGGDKPIAGRFGSALFKQKRSGKRLQDKMRHVQECTDRLVAQANICSMQSQKSLLDEGKDLKSLVVRSTRKQDRGFTTVVLRQDELMEAVRSQEERIQSQQTLLEGQAELLNRIKDTLSATSLRTFRGPPRLMHLECEDSIDSYQTPRGRSPSPGAGPDQMRSRQRLGDLLVALRSHCEIDTAEKDASILLNVIGNLSFSSQNRAAALIMSPILQQWLTSTVSYPLIVDGQMYSSEEETRQSPLSCFCAKLVDSILPPKTTMRSAKSRDIFAVQWFCGQHTNFYDYGPGMLDYDAHPPGMLSNMVGQLITQLLRYPLLPQLNHLPVVRKSSPLSELCSLFTSLVEALPTGSILFIVIDGISYYEDEDRREECMEVLSLLTNMTRGDPGFIHGCLTKLLVTAPLRSHCVQDLFEDTEILDLDEYIAPNGGFTALQWDMGIGRVIPDE